MSQAGLLLLLWDALQQRETTFGQIADLSAACGLDGHQVLADHFASVRLFRQGGALSRIQLIIEAESACPIEAPAQALSGVSVQGGIVELLKERFASDVVHTHENLRGLGPRQAGDHIDHRPIAEKFFVLNNRQMMVGPAPIFTATVKSSHWSVIIMGRRLRRIYAHYIHLSKVFQTRYSCNVSVGVA
ncbi:hypothetical protein [Pseudomonas putida]|uniref:hypothetical protein n=1 Tax=Pseudomonas putida TaxID=303 RepID=UPI0018AA50F8|nr:hypothetical protein [Pseudomonas putida]MBF8727670.1 hypothetical protein [Pseudomonas putida]